MSTCALISLALFDPDDAVLTFKPEVKAERRLNCIRPSQGANVPKDHGASVVADPGQLRQKQTSKQLKA